MSTTGNLVPGLSLFSGKGNTRGAYVPPIDYAVAFEDGAGSADTTPPTVLLISPLAVAAGQPGGFSREYDVAKNTQVVLQVSDLAPGLQYAIVVVRFVGSDDSETEEVVYRRGQFRGRYRALSTQFDITNGVQLNIRRDGGWPANINTNLVSRLAFNVDATDKAGNLDA